MVELWKGLGLVLVETEPEFPEMRLQTVEVTGLWQEAVLLLPVTPEVINHAGVDLQS